MYIWLSLMITYDLCCFSKIHSEQLKGVNWHGYLNDAQAQI